MSRSLVLRSACVGALILVAACDGVTTGSTPAQPKQMDQFVAAADALTAKTGAPGEKAVMPAPNDPAAQAFQTQASQALSALGTEALPIEGFGSYEKLCAKTATVVGAYTLAGTQGTAGPAQQQKMESNLKQHFDTIFTPLLFSVRCNAAHMSFLEGQLDSSDPSKAGALTQVRDGMLGQVLGLVAIAADPSTDAKQREQVIELLAANGSSFALGLSRGQRQEVIEQVKGVAQTMPQPLQQRLLGLTTELANAPCGKICSAA